MSRWTTWMHALWRSRIRRFFCKPANKTKPLMAVFGQIWLGSYPRLNQQGPKSRDVFYGSYIQTYIQRDVQDVLKVSDQTAFNRFLAWSCCCSLGTPT